LKAHGLRVHGLRVRVLAQDLLQTLVVEIQGSHTPSPDLQVARRPIVMSPHQKGRKLHLKGLQ